MFQNKRKIANTKLYSERKIKKHNFKEFNETNISSIRLTILLYVDVSGFALIHTN